MDRSIYLQNNKGLVIKLANKYFMETPKFDFDDLVAVGNNAALRALNFFDEERGLCKVSTYVYKAVEHDIANFVRKNKFDLYVPPCAQKKAHDAFIAGEVNKDLSKFGTPYSPKAIPLSTTYKDNERGVTLAETIPSGAPPIPDTLIKKEQTTILMDEVDQLPKRERDVIMARFFDNRKLKEIASGYGISKQRVEQIQKKALSRLRIKVVKRLDGDMID